MSIGSIVGTAITLGFVHVLTGPDHLSALATLSSTCTSNNNVNEAFWLGVRWGIGHSTGLVVVGSIFITISSSSSSSSSSSTNSIEVPHHVTIAFESLVGIFMILLGCYGILLAFRERSTYYECVSLHNQELDDDDVELIAPAQEEEEAANTTLSLSSDVSAKAIVNFSDVDDVVQRQIISTSLDTTTTSDDACCCCCCKSIFSLCSKCSTGGMALMAGVFHGLAGPGGILGVIPAIQLRDPLLSSIYLGTFCMVSTLVMGGFATAYGCASRKLSSSSSVWEFKVRIFSASLSIIVGVLWILLLLLGKLEDIFG